MKNKDEVWYCVNDKGHKIAPYKSRIIPPDPKWYNIFLIIPKKVYIIILIILGIMLFSSCGTFKMTEREKQVNYELDKLYLEYSYKRDSIIIEYNK